MAPKRKQAPADQGEAQYLSKAKEICQKKVEETRNKIEHKRARVGEKIVHKAVEHRQHLEQYLEKTQLNVSNITDSMTTSDKMFAQLLKKIESVKSKMSTVDKKAADFTTYTNKFNRDVKKEYHALVES